MKSKLFLLGFRESTNQKNLLFLTINDYTLTIVINPDNLSSSLIDYGTKIKIYNQNICNFSKEENIVQLECVIRLLRKGYKPENIELEKHTSWDIRKRAGWMSIFLKMANAGE
jgi:hypothetical protein